MRRKTQSEIDAEFEIARWERRAESAERRARDAENERDRAIRVAAHLADRLGIEDGYKRTRFVPRLGELCSDQVFEFSPAAYEADLNRVREADEAVAARKRLGLEKENTDAG
jgi:hypothetical protein